VLLTNRTIGAAGAGRSLAYGADGTFMFHENLLINTYWARTETDRRDVLSGRGRDTSYRAQLDYAGDRYGLELERLAIGDTFNPEVGFVRRTDMVRNFAEVRFSPRPRTPGAIRKYTSQASFEYVENGAGRLETRERGAEVGLEFQNADRVTLSYQNTFEYLPRAFEIAPSVTLPVGAYRFDSLRLRYNMGQQRRFSANLSLEHGTFYGGRKTTVNAGRARMNIDARLSIEPAYSVNRVSLAQGDFTTHLAGARITYTMTPLMFVSALVQYNSAANAVSTNARFRWEYGPGSELFIVYNEERNTLSRRLSVDGQPGAHREIQPSLPAVRRVATAVSPAAARRHGAGGLRRAVDPEVL
jgi:hypothetical protein